MGRGYRGETEGDRPVRHNMHQRSEVHLQDFPNGHCLSADCWCEPSHTYWVTNKHGVQVFVVEHSDDTPVHHGTVLNERTDHSRDPDPVSTPDAAWITRALDRVGVRPQLPPGETK